MMFLENKISFNTEKEYMDKIDSLKFEYDNAILELCKKCLLFNVEKRINFETIFKSIKSLDFEVNTKKKKFEKNPNNFKVLEIKRIKECVNENYERKKEEESDSLEKENKIKEAKIEAISMSEEENEDKSVEKKNKVIKEINDAQTSIKITQQNIKNLMYEERKNYIDEDKSDVLRDLYRNLMEKLEKAIKLWKNLDFPNETSEFRCYNKLQREYLRLKEDKFVKSLFKIIKINKNLDK